MVKGFEVRSGEYVVLDDDELDLRLRKIVKDKEAGETIQAPPAPKAPGPPPDITEALKASLDKVRAG